MLQLESAYAMIDRHAKGLQSPFKIGRLIESVCFTDSCRGFRRQRSITSNDSRSLFLLF